MPRGTWILLMMAAACGNGGPAPSDAAAADTTPLPDTAAPDAAPPIDVSLAPAWCAPSQPFRRQLTAHNNAATPLPAGFQVDWLIDLEDLAVPPPPQPSLHIFHVSPVGCTELDRVVDDTAAAYEAIWVALVDPIPASGADSSYWLYYGDDTAPGAPADPAQVFDFYDGFESGAAPDADWLTQGMPSVALGALLLGQDDEIMTVQAWPPGQAVDYSLALPSYIPPFRGGFEGDVDDFTHAPPWFLWNCEANVIGPVIWASVLVAATDTVWSGSVVAIDRDPHIYNVDRFADRAVFRYENYPASAEEHVVAAPFPDPLRFRFSNGGAAVLSLHMVRVRQTAYPLPSSSVGAEEAQ